MPEERYEAREKMVVALVEVSKKEHHLLFHYGKKCKEQVKVILIKKKKSWVIDSHNMSHLDNLLWSWKTQKVILGMVIQQMETRNSGG